MIFMGFSRFNHENRRVAIFTIIFVISASKYINIRIVKEIVGLRLSEVYPIVIPTVQILIFNSQKPNSHFSLIIYYKKLREKCRILVIIFHLIFNDKWKLKIAIREVISVEWERKLSDKWIFLSKLHYR